MPKTRRLPMTAGNMLASLEGLKTETRRIMRPQPEPHPDGVDEQWCPSGYWWPSSACRSMVSLRDAHCLSPYGHDGDKLALTETWRPLDVRNIRRQQKALIEYRADGTKLWRVIPDMDAREKIERALKHGKWLPPMFMQTWASRAPAVVKEIRVERVQEISRADAAAEGVCGASFPGYQKTNWPEENFRVLWDSINGDRPDGAWRVNPWCWVVSYELTR